MRSRACACFVLSTFLCSCLYATEVDPRAVIEALRDQMKELKTLKAEYTVDSVNGPSRTPQTAQVTYVKDNDRFCIVETRTDPNGRQIFERTVYDGLEIKRYRRISNDNGPAQGAILPADHRTVRFSDNELMSAAGFSMVSPGSDERFAEHEFEFKGTELIDGHDCLVVVVIAPFLPGHRAFEHTWIEVDGSQYLLRRQKCLIDDRLGMVLYERQYGYEPLDGYPFPTEIKYRRYDINSRGYRNLDYEKLIRVQTVRINEPVDPCEFQFTFPQGTAINVAPPTFSAAVLKDPSPMREPDASERPFDPNLTQPDPRTEFTFTPGQYPLTLPVRFGPRTYDFVLDTGCTNTIFDLSFRPQLGSPLRMQRVSTAARPVVVQAFAAPRAFVGPFNLADCNEVGCANLKGLGPILGREVHGILSMELLKTHVVQIDFDEGRIAFLDDPHADRQDWGQELSITYNQGGMPQTKVVVGNQPEEAFILDTGFGGSVGLEKGLFARVLAGRDLKISSTAVATAGGVTHSREMRSGRVVVGPLEYQGLILGEGEFNLLGLDFLSRHVVTFDFPQGKLYLKKGKDFEKPDETGMSGLSLVRSEGRTVVYAVYEGEPAAKAGLQAGDVILKLQGRDADAYAMQEIRDLLRSGDGKEITMTIQRGRDVRDVVVVLERQI